MKTNYKRMLVMGTVFLLAVSCQTNEEVSPESSQEDSVKGASVNVSVKLKSNQYIVISETDALPEELSQSNTLRRNGASLMESAGVAVVTSTDPDFIQKTSKIEGVRSVIRDARIQWIHPDKEKMIKVDPNYSNPPVSGDDDEYFDLQWGHDAIDAPEAWNAGYRGKGARVAVLDTGFDIYHPDLSYNIDYSASRNFVPEEDLQYGLPDIYSHGTHVAGIVAAADNGIGIIGVAPEAELILVKVMSDAGTGDFSWILEGILHAVEQEADVINMSLGAVFTKDGEYIDEEGNKIDASEFLNELQVALNKVTSYANKKGVTLVAAAGNEFIDYYEQPDYIILPAEANHVISVSATTPIGWALAPFTTFLDNPASYTNFGELAAPGGDILYAGDEFAIIGNVIAPAYVYDLVISTGSNGWYWAAGSSAAAPHVAGTIALIAGKVRSKLPPELIKTLLVITASDLGKSGPDPVYGLGRVHAYRAVKHRELDLIGLLEKRETEVIE